MRAPAAGWVAATAVLALGLGGAVAVTRPPASAAARTLTAGDTSVQAVAAGGAASARPLDPWFVAPSLLKLREEVDDRWPGRDRSSDGTIGDDYHQARSNSHNPVGSRRGPRVGTPGAVHSMDITAAGIDVDTVLSAVIGDPRVWYVIHDGRIWSRTEGWSPRAYRGDPHVSHIHVTTVELSQRAAVAAENDTSPWLLQPVSVGDLRPKQVQVIQRALIRHGFGIPAGPTGKYGGQTTAAMAAFQRAQGWSGGEADGKPGPLTLKRLGVDDLAAAKVKAEKAAKAKATKAKAAKAAKAKATKAAKAAKAKAAKAAKAKATKAAKAKPANAKGTKAKAAKAKAAKARAGATGKVRAGEKAKKVEGAEGAKAKAAKSGKDTQVKATKARAEVKAKAAKAKTAKAAKAKAAEAKAAKAKAAKPSDRLDAADLVPGIASADVYYLQAALAEAGFPIPAGPTGYFGPRTRDAVAAFQRAQGWTGDQADGIPGPGTLRRLGL